MFCAQTVAAAIEAKRVEEMIQAAIAKAKREQELAEQRKKKQQCDKAIQHTADQRGVLFLILLDVLLGK